MENLLEKESVKRVSKFLKKFNSSLSVIVLEQTARTAKDAANALKCEVGAIVKSLVFKADDSFLLCLIAGDKRCSLNKIKKILNKKDVCMADAVQVKSQTGFSIGGVSPIAHINNLKILVDNSLNRFDYVFAAAGHPSCVFKITYEELIKITNGTEKEISE
jgi:Cys-tRNA(Pro) deacylase